jgi:hypothetical protein
VAYLDLFAKAMKGERSPVYRAFEQALRSTDLIATELKNAKS